MKNLVFDLDGTLVDSAIQIAGLLNGLRQTKGMPDLDVDLYRRLVSRGASDLIKAAMECEDHEIDFWLHRFRNEYSCDPANAGHLFPGVEEVLRFFADKGVRMAVCSNKPEILCRKVLNDTGISLFFEAVIGGDSVGVSKPDPRPLLTAGRSTGADEKSVLFIGDSHIDQQTAAAAGVQFAFFASGYDDGVDKDKCAFVFYEMNHLKGYVLAQVAGDA